MKWLLFKSNDKCNILSKVLVKIKILFYRVSCCCLCGENIRTDCASRGGKNASPEALISPIADEEFTPDLVCAYCLKNLPLFQQSIIYSDLLMWPAIHRGLPNIVFDHLFSLSPYLPPFTHWLAQLKYQGKFEIARFFAEMLSDRWHKSYKGSTPDLMLSVPLHLSKWQKRGYNQAHLIAKDFAVKTQIKYLPNAIERIKDNASQMGRTGSQRRKNLKRTFKINSDFTGVKHILLLDDVVTTGTTASEISRLLKGVGVEKVTLVTVCLTLPK